MSVLPVILVIGATGNIGNTLVGQLKAKGECTILAAARSNADITLDIGSPESVEALSAQIPGGVDHVVIACGASQFGALSTFTSESWSAQIGSKLLAVTTLIIKLVNNEGSLAGLLRDNGSITVTAGQASRTINKMWPGIAANNAGLEAFIKNAGLMVGRGIRLNAVSPALITETAEKAGLPTAGTVPAAEVAAAYIPLIFGDMTGEVSDAGGQVAFEKSHHDGMSDKPKEAGRDFMAEKMARKVAEMPDVDPDIDLAALRAKAKAGAAGKTDEEKKALGLLYDKSSAAGVREESEEDEDDESCNMGGDPFEGM